MDKSIGKITEQYRNIDKEHLIRRAVRGAKVYFPPIFESVGKRLYMNENLFGPSPKCLKILEDIQSSDMFVYPYGGNHMIISAIGNRFNIDSDHIVVNNGAASVIQQIFEAVLQKDALIYLPNPGWDYYRGVAELIGANIKYYNVIERDRRFLFNTNFMMKQIKGEPKVIVITSPNMPTGNTISLEDIINISNHFKDTLIILDEAYYGFTDAYEINEKELLISQPNIVIIRTFSKLYGLASSRVGFALCNKELASLINKSSPLFGVSLMSQLMCKVALEDEDYYDQLSKKIIEIRENFRDNIKKIGGLYVYPSKSNFVLVNIGRMNLSELITYLKDNGYLIRDCVGYGLKQHVRISIGTQEDMERIADLIHQLA